MIDYDDNYDDPTFDNVMTTDEVFELEATIRTLRENVEPALLELGFTKTSPGRYIRDINDIATGVAVDTFNEFAPNRVVVWQQNLWCKHAVDYYVDVDRSASSILAAVQGAPVAA